MTVGWVPCFYNPKIRLTDCSGACSKSNATREICLLPGLMWNTDSCERGKLLGMLGIGGGLEQGFIAQPMWLQSWFCQCKGLVSCSAQQRTMVMSASCQSFSVACRLEEHAQVVPPTDSSGGLSTSVFCWYTAENLAKESMFASYITLLWKTLGKVFMWVYSHMLFTSVFINFQYSMNIFDPRKD